MVKNVVLVVVGLLAVVLLVFALAPAKFRISRVAEIEAPPEVVFAILSDLRLGQKWSPFERSDPDMKRTFSGPETGTGSSFTWEGKKQNSAGTLTITEAKPNEAIVMQLEMTRPMAARNKVSYLLTPTATGTKVEWIMEGKHGATGKAASMFINLDEMLGEDFEEGLESLNDLAAQHGKAASGKK